MTTVLPMTDTGFSILYYTGSTEEHLVRSAVYQTEGNKTSANSWDAPMKCPLHHGTESEDTNYIPLDGGQRNFNATKS